MVAVSHPGPGRLLVRSRSFFADPSAGARQQLVGRLFEVQEVRALEIRPADSSAQIEYTNGRGPGAAIVRKIARRLRADPTGGPTAYVNSPGDLPLALADPADGWRVAQ